MTEQPWRLEWSQDHIRNFWDWYGTNAAFADRFFSKMVADAILDQALPVAGNSGVVLDLGCGPGYMVEALLRRGIRVIAADPSPSSIAALNDRISGDPRLEATLITSGLAVPLPDQSVDTVMLIETMEHLDAEVSSRMLSEAYRVLRPGGALVITTPNSEDLSASEVLCPNCNCVFHAVQHIRSLSPQTLSEECGAHGFVTLVAKGTVFPTRKGLLGTLQRWRTVLRRQRPPHLLYIGQRPIEGRPAAVSRSGERPVPAA